MVKILVLGDGLLASEIVNKTNWDYVSRKKDNIDVIDFMNWKHILDSYNIIINCIANTNTYSNDKKSHWDINYKFVSELVDYCNLKEIKLIHISSDYVYTNSIENASEDDVPVHGSNWYSYTKLLADSYIELKSNSYLICRGTHKPNPFPYDKAWIDQIGNFDYVNNISNMIIKLINKNCHGLYNIGSHSKRMIDLAKMTNKNIEEAMKPEGVPNNTTMDLNKMNSEITKEVVIAAYDRNYNWVSQLDKNVLVTVYRKGNGEVLPNEIKIEPNLGRDVHTFFYHLYNRYDSLSDITYFSQDYHLDHVYNYVEIINSSIYDIDKWAIERLENSCWFFNTYFNKILHCENNGYPHDGGLDLKKMWGKLFNTESPNNNFYFTPAGHFAITKEHAQKIHKSVYKKIIDILENENRSPWEIERLEPYIFINNFKDLKID
jgi:dTDP-4-dehydrorhamnose reductase